jgi:hypothetical protein
VKLSFLRHSISFHKPEDFQKVSRSGILMLKTFIKDYSHLFKFTLPISLWNVLNFFSESITNSVYHSVMFLENNTLVYDENGSFETVHKDNIMFPAKYSNQDYLNHPDLCPSRDYSDIVPVALLPTDITSIEGCQKILFGILQQHPKKNYILMKNDIAVNEIFWHTAFSSNPKIKLDQFVINLGSFHVGKHLAYEIFQTGFDSFFFEMFTKLDNGNIYRKPKMAKMYPFLTYVSRAFQKVKETVILLERENSTQIQEFDNLFFLLEIGITVMRNTLIENTMDDYDRYLKNMKSAVCLFVHLDSSRYVDATLMELLLLENLQTLHHPMFQIIKENPSCLNEEREESYLSILDRVLTANQQADVIKTDEILRLLPVYLKVSKEIDPYPGRAIVTINDDTIQTLANNILSQFQRLALGTHKTPQFSGDSIRSKDTFTYKPTTSNMSKFDPGPYIKKRMERLQTHYSKIYQMRYSRAYHNPQYFNNFY